MRVEVLMSVVVTCLLGCGRLRFDSLDDGGSSTSGDSDGKTVTDGQRPDIVFTTNVMFVTAEAEVPGAFGGLAGADARCQTIAANASLSGTYRAWLPTAAESLVARLSGARGWVRPDGRPFADTADDVVQGVVFSPPNVGADGTVYTAFGVSATLVATGADPGGTAGVYTCSEYTNAGTMEFILMGDFTATSRALTTAGVAVQRCAGPARMYCFGVDFNVPIAPPATTGRVAFLAPPWTPGGGLAGADAHCQATASTAGIGGTFGALLPTSTASAASRFTPGTPWVRRDGLPITGTSIGDFFDTSLNVDAAGTTMTGFNLKVWTGAPRFTTPGSSTCNDWGSMMGGIDGMYARPDHTYEELGLTDPCNSSSSLYCLEL